MDAAGGRALKARIEGALGRKPPERVYAVFSYGDPMPFSVCASAEVAEAYVDGLSRLPEAHPLHTKDAQIEVLPLVRELPEPLRDPENQPVLW